jgi:hypothetical protein
MWRAATRFTISACSPYPFFQSLNPFIVPLLGSTWRSDSGLSTRSYFCMWPHRFGTSRSGEMACSTECCPSRSQGRDEITDHEGAQRRTRVGTSGTVVRPIPISVPSSTKRFPHRLRFSFPRSQEPTLILAPQPTSRRLPTPLPSTSVSLNRLVRACMRRSAEQYPVPRSSISHSALLATRSATSWSGLISWGVGVQPPIAPLTDPVSGLTFPNFNARPNELLQANLIFPVPCEFVSLDLPLCAVIRPTSPGQISAAGAINGLIADRLFVGQSPEFTELLLELAQNADAAQRQVG